MMKLNNKGFAVTTVLYGVLSITLVVVMLVLGTIRTRRVLNTNLVSSIENRLNKCIDYELAYELCTIEYRDESAADRCFSQEYLACIGASEGNYYVPIGKYPEALLSSLLKVNSNDIKKDIFEKNRYIYTGNNPNNYIKFNNNLGRIVSFEPDGSLKVIFYNLDGNIKWDNTVGYDNPYVSSNIENVLNVSYANQFLYTTKIVKKKNWSVGSVYDYNNLEEVVDREQLIRWEGYFGLITYSDYIMASSNCSLNKDLSNFSCSSHNNWLNTNNDFWLLTDSASKTTEVYYINESGVLSISNKNNSKKVYPVVFFKNNVVISEGNGTIDEPYIIEF